MCTNPYISPFLLENGMPMKYSLCSPFLSPHAIRDRHVTSSVNGNKEAVIQVTFWLRQWKVCWGFLSSFLPCYVIWECFRRLSLHNWLQGAEPLTLISPNKLMFTISQKLMFTTSQKNPGLSNECPILSYSFPYYFMPHLV